DRPVPPGTQRRIIPERARRRAAAQGANHAGGIAAGRHVPRGPAAGDGGRAVDHRRPRQAGDRAPHARAELQAAPELRSGADPGRAPLAMTAVPFDASVANLLLRYARMIAARGYVHNSLGNLAIRVDHPDFPHGVAYTKHAEVSLEEMTLDNVVITDIPTPALLHGTVPTSVGHNLNREILRLRPDVDAVIHAHHDETIALFASGALQALRGLCADVPSG